MICLLLNSGVEKYIFLMSYKVLLNYRNCELQILTYNYIFKSLF
jgi:hypothetical protein